MRVSRIETADDGRVADYRHLTDSDARRASGLFVVEGREIVSRLLATARFRTRSVLVTEPALRALAERLAGVDVPVYLAPNAVVERIVGYKFHRGCVAIAERGREPDLASLLETPGPRLLVVTERLADPDNVGGVFRNALAFGADGVLLSSRCADPLYRKAIRVSVGASLVVPFVTLSAWTDALAALRRSGYTLVALTPDASAVDLGVFAAGHRPERMAILLGSEGCGLSPETRGSADVEVRIAMARGVDSLNVATAAGIALHRLGPG